MTLEEFRKRMFGLGQRLLECQGTNSDGKLCGLASGFCSICLFKQQLFDAMHEVEIPTGSTDGLMEQLAIHAPQVPLWFEIPTTSPRPADPDTAKLFTAWFPPVLRDQDFVKMLNLLEADPIEHPEVILRRMQHKGVRIPENIKDAIEAVAIDVERVRKEQEQWHRRDTQRRLSQWPWAYARMVLEARP